MPRKEKSFEELQPVGRKCSICSHPDELKINALVRQGTSFRDISRQISGKDSMKDSLIRHTENCLFIDIRAVLQEKKIKNAIDHYSEMLEQLDFAKQLRISCQEILTDTNTGRVSLLPRASSEVTVIYEDHADLDDNLRPKNKSAKLQVLLDEIRGNSNKEPTGYIIKQTDIRDYALKTIAIVQTVLDMFAKVEGLYQKERENVETLEATARNIIRALRIYPNVNAAYIIQTTAQETKINEQLLISKIIELRDDELSQLPALLPHATPAETA